MRKLDAATSEARAPVVRRLKRAMKRNLPPWIAEALRLGYLRYRSIAFLRQNRGDRYVCNFCGARALRFMPSVKRHPVCAEMQIIGAQFVENFRCPRCFSTPRQRLLKLAIERHCDRPGLGDRALHVAPERALHQFLADRYKDLQSCDLDPVRYCSWARNISRQDLTGTDFPDQSFDFVLCSHVLEHIPDDRAAMRELFRILRPGGRAVLQVPYSEIIAGTEEDPAVTSEEERLRLYGQKDHVRIYHKADYIHRLESIGFTSMVLSPAEFRGDRRHAINEKESVFLFAKD